MTAMRTSKRVLFLALLCVCTVWVLFSDRHLDALYILLPMVAAIWICSLCASTIWKRDGELPILDIGMFCVSFTTLYTVIPLMNFYFGGFQFGLLSDGRLQRHAPSAGELGLFFVNHIVYLTALASTYTLLRRNNRRLPRLGVEPPRPRTVRVIVIAFLALTAYFAAMMYVFGIGFRSAYIEEQQISEGPLWLAQINGKAAEVNFIFQAAVLAILVYWKNDIRARWLLFLLIAWNITTAFAQPGSRGELMSLLLLTFLFWHKFHGTPWRLTFAFLPTAFIAFMFLGLLRSFLDLQDLASALDNFETLASATNEFQAMLGTAYDVFEMLKEGVSPPPVLAFNDVMPMLPPQQLWPFEKISGADWYLVQIGQQGLGVGFMWGVVTQSLIGFGLIELVIRGIVLGWFLAQVHHWYQRRYTKFLPSVLYVLLCITTLWTFRDTTGAILWTIWWAILPFAAIVYVFGSAQDLMRPRPPRHTYYSVVPTAAK
jgi:hypothetical protein